jgi:hypothetical protein
MYNDKLLGFYTGTHWVKTDKNRAYGLYNGHYVGNNYIHEHVEQHNLTFVHKGKNFEIWHKPATTNWVARYEKREYEPAMYIVVEKTDKVIGAYTAYNTLEVKWTTRKHGQVLKALIAEYEGAATKPEVEAITVEADKTDDEILIVMKLKFMLARLEAKLAGLESPETMYIYEVDTDQSGYARQEGRIDILESTISEIKAEIKDMLK